MRKPTHAAWTPDFLDKAALAHLVQCSRRQVQRMLAAGKLPPADRNLTGSLKGRRWRRDNVLAWLDGQGRALRGAER